MKPTTLVFITLMCFNAVQAQTSETATVVATDSVSGSDKTIYFFFVNQYAATYQSFISEDLAWAISADITGSISSESSESTPVSQTQDAKTNSFSISISPQMQWFFNLSTHPVQLYVGAGPTLKYSRSYFRADYRNDPYQSILTYNMWSTESFEAGVLLTGGLEATVFESLSFVAKYELYGTYGTDVQKSEDNRNEFTRRKKRWILSMSQMRLGIGVHF